MCDSKNIVFLLLYSLTALLGCSCSPCSTIAESQQTVRTADSLRVHEGVAYDDSVVLAEAYSTLGCWRWIYPDDYARACYYYGRMLRNRGDQVSAMQVFIRGSHAPYVQRVVPLLWFSDYHILGRIYSNMGTMCHVAGEYQLAFDMYDLSAQQFKRSNDTTAYFFTLNAKALQLAKQNKHDEALNLLSTIRQECTDNDVLTKTWETKAQLYISNEQFDSAIFSVRKLYIHGYTQPTGYVMIAQAFWSLLQYDSAIWYAKYVIDLPNIADNERYNMLYILTYNDSTIDSEEIKKRSEERNDINRYILDPLAQQLTHAVDLLCQDFDKRPHFFSLATFLLALFVIGGFARFAIYRIKRQHKQNINELNSKQKEVQEYISAKQEENKQLDNQLTTRQQQIIQDIENTCEVLRQCKDWDKELQWKDYSALCDFINHHFYLLANKLTTIYGLEEKEVRLSILVLMDMFNNEVLARILHYGKGIRTYKSRLNAKLGNKGNDLRTKLIQIAVSSSESIHKS